MRLRTWIAGAVVCALPTVGMAAAGDAIASPTLGFESSSVLAANASSSASGSPRG
jgi:hypothetical protein